MRPAPGEQGGRALAELLVALLALSLLLSAAVGLGGTRRRRAVESAAFGLAESMRRLAVEARSDGRQRAVVFPESGADEPLRLAADGGGDGVTRAGVDAGDDPAGPAFRLAAEHPGVRIGRLPRSGVPALPPSSSVLDPQGPAVRFGTRRIAALTPEGHATPGSLFVTDGRDGLCAVVVNGATARIRVWCLDPGGGAWRLR